MRAFGEILLVSCYELGHQPLGAALPAAFLERAGFAPALADLSVEHLDDEAVARARLVALSVPMHTALRIGERVAERVRAANPDAHICFFGLYASLNREHLLGGVADSVLGGEIEEALVGLAASLADGSALAPVDAPILRRLDFPVPSRRSLPALDRYAKLDEGGATRLAGAVETTRGCKHSCRHCPITPVYRGRFFAVPRDVVLADIAQLVEGGVTHVSFADPDFLNGPRHALLIARELHARWPHLTWDATIKVEHILEHEGMFEELRELGCLFVISAFESVNDAVLEELAKGHTAADIVRAIAILRRAGIALRPTFVAFSPWETLESRIALFELMDSQALVGSVDPIQLTLRLLVPPGSPLLERESMRRHLVSRKPSRFSYDWVHPDARMQQLVATSVALVEEATERAEPPTLTFQRLYAQTLQVAGLPPRAFPSSGDAAPAVPRLTESWFCCAEPSESQFAF